MAGVAFVVVIFGYAVMYYGLCEIAGNGASFADVLFPHHYVPKAKT